MAQMTEADASQLLVSAATLASTLAALIPTLVQNFQAIREGWATDDANALDDKIKGIHADVQALDAQLLALRS